nr:aldo/keto reductase [Auraticoccus cholistanensis]
MPGLEVPLSRAVLGTMSFGDTTDAARAEEVFEAAVGAGVSGVDTANGYAGGETERIIAPLVRRHRDRIVLATKAGIPHPDAGGRPPLSAEALRRSLEGSLRRLGVDHVDLFYLHQPDRATPLAETVDALAGLHAAGRFTALGVSNHAAWQAADVAAAAGRAGIPVPVVGQNVYNLLARRIEDEWLEYATTHRVHTMVYNPLAGGLLGSRPDPDAPPSRFRTSRLAQMYSRRYWSPELLAAAGAVADVADEAGMPLAELSLRWVVSRPGVGSVLLGANRTAHVLAGVEALARGPLPADLVERLDRLTEPLRGAMPAYNR